MSTVPASLEPVALVAAERRQNLQAGQESFMVIEGKDKFEAWSRFEPLQIGSLRYNGRLMARMARNGFGLQMGLELLNSQKPNPQFRMSFRHKLFSVVS